MCSPSCFQFVAYLPPFLPTASIRPPAAAGVFTQPNAVQYVLTAFDEAIARGDIPSDSVTQELLEGYLSGFGRKFYGVEDNSERIIVRRDGAVIPQSVKGEGVEVVPFRRGTKTWSVEWV